MTKTCCLDCLASCYQINCRDSDKTNGKYAGWCTGEGFFKSKCMGVCVFYVGKEN